MNYATAGPVTFLWDASSFFVLAVVCMVVFASEPCGDSSEVTSPVNVYENMPLPLLTLASRVWIAF